MTPSQALQLTSIREIKDALSMAYVMEHYGHFPAEQNASALHYLSPFRNESRASFDVFLYTIGNNPDPEYRYDDRADPNLSQGDVIDLIQQFEPGLSRAEAISKAQELLAEQIRTEWDSYTVVVAEKPGLNLAAVETMVDLRRPLLSSDTWFETLNGRPGLADATLPEDTVFKHHEHDTVVFVLRDEHGEIKGARLRLDDQAKRTVPGTHQILLRLEPPRTHLPVFLTEGETDTFAAWTHLQGQYEVLGVPGVGNHPAQVAGEYLDGREVVVAFDSDSAGTAGATVWRDFLLSKDCKVRIVVLGQGQDIAGLTGEQIRKLPAESRVLPPDTDAIVLRQDQFCITRTDKRTGDVEYTPIANWGFVPGKLLIGEDGTRSYEGLLLPRNESVVLPSHALTSKNALLKWGAPYQARWSGNDVNVQHLAWKLDHQAAFLPAGRITDQVGLLDGTFVWPDKGKVGMDDAFYEPPKSDPGFSDEMFHIVNEPVDVAAVFQAMYESQHPAVTGPILAWLACAPLRTRFDKFPVLSISGVSGSGKTALTEELIQVFSGTNISVNLTSTTKYGVESLINCSNGFPIRFDEYRPGANPTAKLALDQLARDAYGAQTGIKGGQNSSDLSQTSRIRTDAPIVITGEDNFSEQSHMERMILVRLVRSEQGDLPALQHMETAGFAHAYLRSLLMSETAIDEAPVFSNYRIDAYDRVKFNTKVLHVGWNLLSAFLRYHAPEFNMPALDLSRINLANEEAAKTDPVMDAIQYYYENDLTQSAEIVWLADGFLNVSPTNLMAAERRNSTVILPTSNAKGIKDLLIENRGFHDYRVRSITGRQMRVVRLHVDHVDWLSDEEKSSHLQKDTSI